MADVGPHLEGENVAPYRVASIHKGGIIGIINIFFFTGGKYC